MAGKWGIKNGIVSDIIFILFLCDLFNSIFPAYKKLKFGTMWEGRQLEKRTDILICILHLCGGTCTIANSIVWLLILTVHKNYK